MKDRIDDIPCTEGTRLRVLLVWDRATDAFAVRGPGDEKFNALGMLDMAKDAILAQNRDTQLMVEPTKVIQFPGPKEPQ